MFIHKFPVPVNKNFFDLAMPYGAKILAFQVQRGMPFIWALVDIGAVADMRHFAVRSTGEAMNDWRSTDTYIGTVQMPPFVWHLFETKE